MACFDTSLMLAVSIITLFNTLFLLHLLTEVIRGGLEKPSSCMFHRNLDTKLSSLIGCSPSPKLSSTNKDSVFRNTFVRGDIATLVGLIVYWLKDFVTAVAKKVPFANISKV